MGAARIPDFPSEVEMQVIHLLLAHHGQLEFGSPKLPQTLEAFVLHMIDNLDAKVSAITELKEKAPEGQAWSDYQRSMERYIYLRDLD